MMTHRSHRVAIRAAAAAAGAWLGFTALGGRVARLIAERFSGPLQRASDGKFDNPVTFVHGRLVECMVLATLALALCLAASWIWKWLGARPAVGRARGLVMSAVVFAILNFFAWSCGQTVVFWALFYNKVEVDNFAQYHIKRALMAEIEGKRRAILIGSSQANRSIDEVLMNQQIGESIWTTELTQAGVRGFDLLPLTRDMPLKTGDLVICYLSEIMFYGEGHSIVAPDFLNFSEVPDILELRGWNLVGLNSIRSGLLGRILPLYRYRNSLSHRVFGWPMVNLEQLRFDQSLEPDLEEQAARRAPKLTIGETSRFEEAAFARMIGELAGKGCTTLVIAGHTHPSMQKHVNPAVMARLEQFLSELAARHPERMKLVDADDFFSPRASDFTDLVHFSKEAQRHLTLELTRYLMAHPATAPD